LSRKDTEVLGEKRKKERVLKRRSGYQEIRREDIRLFGYQGKPVFVPDHLMTRYPAPRYPDIPIIFNYV